MKSLLTLFDNKYPVGSRWHIRNYEYVYVITGSNEQGIYLKYEVGDVIPTYWSMEAADRELRKVK